MIHHCYILQAIKPGSGGRSGNEAVSEITLMARLQVVSCPDPLTREPDWIATLLVT